MAYLDQYLQARNERLGVRHKAKSKKIKPNQVIKGDRRKHVVSKIMDTLSDWRFSPFELEGAVHHGIRSTLCLDGNGWGRADLEAGGLINEAFRLMGVERPSWDQGQRQYVEPRENCKWCSGLLPDDLQRGGTRFMYCSEHCAKSARFHSIDEASVKDSKARNAIYSALKRIKSEPKICEVCEKPFRPKNGTERLCSVECRVVFKTIIPMKSCVQCGIEFKPRMSQKMLGMGFGKFCGNICRGNYMATEVYERDCVQCGTHFQGGSRTAKFCSVACKNHVERHGLGSDVPLPGTPRPCICQHCNVEFFVTNAKPQKYCSKKCSRVVEQLKLKQRKLEQKSNVIYLTPEIFDGWFKQAA